MNIPYRNMSHSYSYRMFIVTVLWQKNEIRWMPLCKRIAVQNMAYPNYGEYEDIKKSSHIEVFHLDLLSENCKMQRGSFIMI